MNPLNSRIKSGLAWAAACQLAGLAIHFVVSVILARLLSPQEFGLLAMVMVFIGFAGLFADLGLGASLIQRRNLQEEHLSTVFWINVASGVSLSLVMLSAAPLLAWFYDEPRLTAIAAVLSLSFVIGSLNVVQNALLQRELDFRRRFRIVSSAMVAGGLVAIPMAATGWGVWSLVAQELVSGVVRVCLMWRLSPWRPSFLLRRSAIRELAHFSVPLLGFDVLNYWARNFDNLLVGRFLGMAALGAYSRAYQLMLLPLQEITRVVTRVMFPALSVIQSDRPAVRRMYLRMHGMIALVTFPMMMGMLVLAEPFILAVYGTKWAEVVDLLRVLCFAGLLQSVGTTVGWIFLSQGRTDIQFRWGLFAAIIRTLAFIVGLQWGVLGVALSYVLSSYLILWYPSWRIAGQLIDLTFTTMVQNVAGSFVCASLMAIAVALVDHTFLVWGQPWLRLALGVPFGVFVYLGVVHLFRLTAWIEVQRTILPLLRERFGRIKAGATQTGAV